MTYINLCSGDAQIEEMKEKKVRKRDEGSCPSVMHSCYDLCLRLVCCIYLLKCS